MPLTSQPQTPPLLSQPLMPPAQIDELSLLNGLFMASGNPRNILSRVIDPESTMTLFAPVDAAIDAVLTAGGISWDQLLSSRKMPVGVGEERCGGWAGERKGGGVGEAEEHCSYVHPRCCLFR
jgi:hypothetical protein